MSRYTEENELLVSQLADIFPSNDALYTSISSLIRGYDAEKIAGLVAQMAAQGGGWLSLTQTEALLLRAQELGLLDHRIQHALVRLCNQPWQVNRDLGGSGICYYGNFGETPFLQAGLSLVLANVRITLGKH